MATKATYSEKLRDPRWQKRRLEIMQRAEFKCECCGDEKTEFHIHHTKYTGEPWQAPDEALECLCRECHFIKEDLKGVSRIEIISFCKTQLCVTVFLFDKILKEHAVAIYKREGRGDPKYKCMFFTEEWEKVNSSFNNVIQNTMING